MRERPLIVAIDGPSGAGKSTVARRLAQRLGIPFLDTGAMYRAIALRVLEAGVDPDDARAVASLAERAEVSVRLDASGRADILLDGQPVEPRIRTAEVGAVTSRIAIHAAVRSRLAALQRELARRHGGVLEGRDIGTQVVPEARFKFYLDAPLAVRAERRHAELAAAGQGVAAEEIERQLAERDARDRGRATAPLAVAADAVRLDTAERSPDEIVDELVRRVQAAPG